MTLQKMLEDENMQEFCQIMSLWAQWPSEWVESYSRGSGLTDLFTLAVYSLVDSHKYAYF